MKVQLVVVRGKPEGKVIPLVGPKFKIGRGETCHLRPISEQVSREHAEFTIDGDAVVVRDLGSRNGTLVNGKALTRCVPAQGPRPGAGGAADVRRLDPGCTGGRGRSHAQTRGDSGCGGQTASPDDISTDDIDSWLIGPNAGSGCRSAHGRLRRRHHHDHPPSRTPPRLPSRQPTPAPASVESDDEYERQPEDGAGEDARSFRGRFRTKRTTTTTMTLWPKTNRARVTRSPRNSWTNPTPSMPPRRP